MRILAIATALATCFVPTACGGPADAGTGTGTGTGAASQPTTKTSSAQPESERTEALGQLLSADDYELIAGGVHEGPALPVADVLAAPESYTEQASLRLEGDIVSVCQNKGCWLRMGDAEQDLFVKFGACDKYVPLDAAGRRVLVEGKLSIEEVSVEEQKHMLEDAGKTEEAAKITEPKRSVRFAALGAAIAK